jgi:hypothetical protein
MPTSQKRTLADGTIKIYSYETNKTYNNKYYTENKDTLLKKTICECGGSYHKLNKMRHIRTNKHNKYINKN